MVVSSATGELCPLAIKAFAKLLALDATAWSIPQIQVCSRPATAQPGLRSVGCQVHPVVLGRQPRRCALRCLGSP